MDITPNTASASTAPASDRPASKWRSLRIWPVPLLLLGMIVAKYIPSLVEDGPALLWMVSAMGPLLMSLLILLWWVTFSRARWFERLLGLVGIALAAGISVSCLHKTMIGPAIMVVMIPLGMALFGIGAMLLSRVHSVARTVLALLLASCGFGAVTLLRADGMWGDFKMGLHWRWQETSEQQLAKAESAFPSPTSPIQADELLNPQSPSFRGSESNSRFRGVKLSSDWSTNPPKQVWKTMIGPGWSSFVVAGDWLFTQEQRESQEAVVCYSARDGKLVWRQEVESRFENPLGGPGPRATPALAGAKLFTFGAEGWLQCLNPLDGKMLWQQDVRKVADCKPPMWGFSSSPLVVGSVVVIYAGGENDKGVLAFNVDSGELAWSAPTGKDSYSSPQLCNLAGEDSIVMLTSKGMTLLDPATGENRFDYDWSINGYRSLQPQLVGSDSILIPTGMGNGTRLVQVEKAGKTYSAKEVWTSRQLKPDFNDFVTYQGYAYGFDALIFTCIDLKTGERTWKGGRYGKGQVLLAEDSGLLLVASEEGDLVLVKADPEKHLELGKIKALEGRTWNHPVLIGNRLYIRNSQEAACYELPVASEAGGVAFVP